MYYLMTMKRDNRKIWVGKKGHVLKFGAEEAKRFGSTHPEGFIKDMLHDEGMYIAGTTFLFFGEAKDVPVPTEEAGEETPSTKLVRGSDGNKGKDHPCAGSFSEGEEPHS